MFTIKHATVIVFGLLMIIGWNAFLIARDNKLFEAYNQSPIELRQK